MISLIANLMRDAQIPATGRTFGSLMIEATFWIVAIYIVVVGFLGISVEGIK